MICLRNDIKKLVSYYKKKYNTSNPFELAKQLHIEVLVGDIGSRDGCYMYLKKHKCIFLNENLDEHLLNFVMAHELGHAIMHPKQNCYFIRSNTFLLISKTENEANKFAIELLISDDDIEENKEFTTEQMARLLGYDQKLIELRLKN